VVVDLHTHACVDVRGVPPGLQLLVLVDALDERAELSVAAHGDVDPHLLDGLSRSQSGLALSLRRNRLVDSVFGLLVERHARSVRLAAQRQAAGSGWSDGVLAGEVAVSWK
jgi:hypothetical protein